MSAPVTFRLESPTFTACGLTWQWQVAAQAWVAVLEDAVLRVYRVWRGVYEACDGTRFPTPEAAAEWSHHATFTL